MHELGITQDMLNIALQQAAKEGITRITRINLVLGETSDLSSDSIQLYFETISKGTAAEGAELSFLPTPGHDLYIESFEGE